MYWNIRNLFLKKSITLSLKCIFQICTKRNNIFLKYGVHRYVISISSCCCCSGITYFLILTVNDMIDDWFAMIIVNAMRRSTLRQTWIYLYAFSKLNLSIGAQSVKHCLSNIFLMANMSILSSQFFLGYVNVFCCWQKPLTQVNIYSYIYIFNFNMNHVSLQLI